MMSSPNSQRHPLCGPYGALLELVMCCAFELGTETARDGRSRRRAPPKARGSAPNVAHATPASHYSRRSAIFGGWVLY